MRNFLLAACRFQDNNIVLLHDEQPHEDYQPTKVSVWMLGRWLFSCSSHQLLPST